MDIKQHGGRIWVERGPVRGSTFVFEVRTTSEREGSAQQSEPVSEGTAAEA